MFDVNGISKRRAYNVTPDLRSSSGLVYHAKIANYIDSSRKKWSEVDCCLNELPSGFEMEKADFYFKADLRSTGWTTMISNGRYSAKNKCEIIAPDFSQRMRCVGARTSGGFYPINNVPGKLYDLNGNGRLDSVIYLNAFDSIFKAHLVYFACHGKTTSLQKLIVFDDPNKVPLVVTDFEFQIEYSSKAELTPGTLKYGEVLNDEIVKWDRNLTNGDSLYLHSDNEINNGLRVGTWGGNRLRGIGMGSPTIRDSSISLITGLAKIRPIDCFLKRITGNTYLLSKQVKPSDFKDVEFPIITDAIFYPDPDSEGSPTSVDGLALHSDGAGLTWAAIIAAAGTGSNQAVASAQDMEIRADTISNMWDRVFNSIFVFDINSFPVAAGIESGEFSVYGFDKVDGFSTPINPNINLYSSNPASNINLAPGDYDSLGNTAFSSSISFGSFNVSGYNAFVLNGAAIAAILGQTHAKFGLQNANYVVAATPPGWEASKTARIRGYYADDPGLTRSPKLILIPGGRISRYHSLNGLGGQGQHTWNPLG